MDNQASHSRRVALATNRSTTWLTWLVWRKYSRMNCSTGSSPADRLVAQGGGDPQLLAARQHVGGLAGVEVQLVAEPEEKFAGPPQRRKVFLARARPASCNSRGSGVP